MMGTLKSVARTVWPYGYYQLAKLRASRKHSWDYYFDAQAPVLLEPERCIIELAGSIPPSIDTFFNIGCAPGRDFVPFQGKLKLRGIDVAPFERVRWVCNPSNLDYKYQSAQSLTDELMRGDEDLSKTLIYTSGTMMVLNASEQLALYRALKLRGCKNFIFQEPPIEHPDFGIHRANRCFHLPTADFTQMSFRNDGVVAFVSFTETDTAQ